MATACGSRSQLPRIRQQEFGRSTFQYDINRDAAGESPKVPLNDVARAVKEAVVPLSKPAKHQYSVGVADYEFAGHLGVASHELFVTPRLADEEGEFIEELPVAPPPTCVARWYMLFELHSRDWDGRWWESLTWRHAHSWRAVDGLRP